MSAQATFQVIWTRLPAKLPNGCRLLSLRLWVRPLWVRPLWAAEVFCWGPGSRAPGAHGDQCGGAARPLQLVQCRSDQARTGGADRMAQRDRPAIDVHLRHI